MRQIYKNKHGRAPRPRTRTAKQSRRQRNGTKRQIAQRSFDVNADVDADADVNAYVQNDVWIKVKRDRWSARSAVSTAAASDGRV